MKTNDLNLKMITNTQALKLGELLDILDSFLVEFPVYHVKLEEEKIIELFKDFDYLSKHCLLEKKEFAKTILKYLNITGKNVEQAIEEIFSKTIEVDSDLDVCTIFIDRLDIFQTDKLQFRIVDFKNRRADFASYSGYKTIAFDFLEKLQSKLWQQIVDHYYKYMYISSSQYDLSKYNITLPMEIVQNLILLPSSCCTSFFKTNLTNWAIAMHLVVDPEGVDVVFSPDTNSVYIGLNIKI